MTIQQAIQQRLHQLPPEFQQELLDFMEFLLFRMKSRRLSDKTVPRLKFGRMSPDYLPPTELEAPDAPSVYRGPPLTLEDMRAAIEDEAGRH